MWLRIFPNDIMRGSSSVWLEHLFVEQGVGGSSPPYRTTKRSQEC